MTEIISNNIYPIIGAVLLASFVGYITYRNNKKNRAAEASIIFRKKIITELEGLYPVTQDWDKGTFSRFYASIPKIESAATEFKPYVFRKKAFDTAVKEYCEYCKNITWDEVFAYTLYKDSMDKKPGDKGPREKFKNIVESLLSFVKEK